MTAWLVLAPIWFDELVVLGPTCEAHDCRAVARHAFTWPGQERARQCDRHARWCACVADALGFVLELCPLPVRDPGASADDASVRFSLLELT